MRITLVSFMLATSLGAAPYNHDVDAAEEFRPRAGLPNLFARLQAGGPVRIAYLGGSITAAQGWRPKTLAWFRAQYPKAEVVEINAAISGTGSDFGACRVRGDVLAQAPDLVFLECRVNGGGGFEQKSVEGIVRQIWKQSPRTDKWRTDGMLRGAIKCSRAGETLTVKWHGTTVGMSDIPYGDPAVVEAVVDGGTPLTMKRVQTEQARKYARFWYLPELPPADHTVTFTVKEIAAGSWFYAGQFLIVGTLSPRR